MDKVTYSANGKDIGYVEFIPGEEEAFNKILIEDVLGRCGVKIETLKYFESISEDERKSIAKEARIYYLKQELNRLQSE